MTIRAGALGLVLLLLAAARGAAQEGSLRPVERLVVVVRLLSPEDAELLPRLLGQTTDLDVALLTAPGDRQPESSLGAELRAASVLAQAHGARVVVWLRRRGGQRTVYVAEPLAERVFVRELRAAAPERRANAEATRSADLEEFAVVVRSALRALAQGDAIGIDNAAAEAAEQPKPPPPAPPPPRPRPGLVVTLGWQAVVDGTSPFGQMGPALRAELHYRRMSFSLLLGGSIPATLTDSLSTVHLSRHAVGLGAGLYAVQRPRVRLALGAALELLLFYRSTEAVQPGYTATPPRLVPAFQVGPEVRLHLRLFRQLWLAGEVAADVIIGRPDLVYQIGNMVILRDSLWPVQPRFNLGLALATF